MLYHVSLKAFNANSRVALGDFDSEEGVDAVMTCPLEQSLVFFLNNSEIVSEPVP